MYTIGDITMSRCSIRVEVGHHNHEDPGIAFNRVSDVKLINLPGISGLFCKGVGCACQGTIGPLQKLHIMNKTSLKSSQMGQPWLSNGINVVGRKNRLAISNHLKYRGLQSSLTNGFATVPGL